MCFGHYGLKTRQFQQNAHCFEADFGGNDFRLLSSELAIFQNFAQSHKGLNDLNTIGDLCKAMVETSSEALFPIYFRLLVLVLTLPVTTATVERAFSAMKIVKTRLRTTIGDSYFRDLLILYVERDISKSISNEAVIKKFRSQKPRRLDF